MFTGDIKATELNYPTLTTSQVTSSLGKYNRTTLHRFMSPRTQWAEHAAEIPELRIREYTQRRLKGARLKHWRQRVVKNEL